MPKQKTVTIKNTSAVTLQGVKPGGTINVPVAKDGVVKSRYWRNRIRDAKIDGCIEIVKEVVKEVVETVKPKKGDK